MSRLRRFLNVLISIFALGVIISGAVVCGTLIKLNMESLAIVRLTDVEMSDAPETENLDPGVIRSRALAEKSEDYKAWLSIEGSRIDYPVMGNDLDSQYYLHRDFDGNFSLSGTPFLGEGCSENSQSIIIYAHHMNNGTMFGELENYEKQEYRDEHPIICFDTVDEARKYKVVAAFRTRLLYDNEDGFRYYDYIGELDEQRLDEFEREVAAVNVYDSTPDFGMDGRYIMLSTCAYHEKYGRFVVVGMLVEE